MSENASKITTKLKSNFIIMASLIGVEGDGLTKNVLFPIRPSARSPKDTVKLNSKNQSKDPPKEESRWT